MPTPLTLKVFRGDELVRTERFEREIIKIGRLSSAHLCLEDDRISRIHSVIEVGPEGISIIDMGSAEGTFVNGKRVSKGALQPGDEIKLGGLRIVLERGANVVAEPVNRALDVPGAAVPAPARGTNGNGNGNGHGTADGHALAGLAAAVAHAQATSNGHAPAVAAAIAPAPAATAAAPAPAAAPVATAAVGAAAVAVAAPAEAAAPATARARRPAMAVARPVPDEPLPPGAPDHGVELRLLWGDTLLDARTFVAPKRPVLLGEGPRCDFRLSGPNLPVDGPDPAFPILRYEEGEYRFLFVPSMPGGVQEKPEGPVRTFAELVQARVATPDDAAHGAHLVAVPRTGAVRADLGSGLRVEARFRRPPKAAMVPFWERIDYRYLWLLLTLLFFEAAFLVAAVTTAPGVDLVQDDLATGQQRMAKFVMKPPEQQKKNPELEKMLARLKNKEPGEAAERHKGEEGQMGKRDAPKTTGRSAPKAIDPNAKELVRNSGLLGALANAKGTGGLSTVMGGNGLGGDLKGAIGNMFGPTVGDSRGVGGLGLKGTGPGGGGQGETIGIGAVGTKGRGGGMGGYGSGVGGLGSKRDRDIAIASETRVMGNYDAELVRKVVRDHAAQVQYCYEQQLTLNPKLTGKVSIKWIINAEGHVDAPSNNRDATTLPNEQVTNCIISRLRTWEFPKPKGGGEAVVTYGWILRPSGAMAE